MTAPRGDRWRRWGPILIPAAVLGVWFSYLWFVSGVLPSVERYPSGQVKEEGAVKRSGFTGYARHGAWKTWHVNGKLASEGQYVEGRQVGVWRYFDESGKLEREEDLGEGH